MFLSEVERASVIKMAQELGLEGEPEEILSQATNAVTLGYADDNAKRIVAAAGGEVIADGIWAGPDRDMTPATARAIINQARSGGNYDGPVPEDDSTAVAQAEEIVQMAEAAYNAMVRGPEVMAILNLAANQVDEIAVEDLEIAEEGLTAANEAFDLEVPPQEKEESVDEPWSNYDEHKLAEIYSRLPYADDDLLDHVYEYETAHKGRIRVLNRIEEERGKSNEEVEENAAPEEKPQEPRAEKFQEDRSAEQVSGEEPYVGSQQASNVSDWAPKSNAGFVTGSEGSEQNGEASDEVAEEEELARAIEETLKRERLHVPPPIEAETPELPFDLTEVPDRELRRLYSNFTALAYRVSYLLMIEEAKARNFKDRSDELYQELLVRAEKVDHDTERPKTLDVLRAEIEQDPNIKKWRRKQRTHESFALAYRHEMQSYYKVLESLSRLASMRQQEFERSGGL